MEMVLKRIRDLREDHDLTQKQVADVLGIYQQSYSNYETGAQKLPIRYLLVLAGLYDCNVDYMLGLTSYRHPLDSLTEPFYRSITLDMLLSDLFALTTEKRKHLFLYLRFLQ